MQRGGHALSVPVLLVGTAVLLAALAADGWRWHLGTLGDVASAQAMWGLGAFGFAVSLSGGRVLRGLTVGAAFGGVAIASYYMYEWLAYDAQAATSQLSSTGRFWIPAALVGGGICGVLGSLAARLPSSRRLDPCALGWTTMAAVPLGELVDLGWHARFFDASSVVVPGLVLLLVATLLVAFGVRRSGWRRVLVAGLVVLSVAPLLGLVFVWAELRLGYLTL